MHNRKQQILSITDARPDPEVVPTAKRRSFSKAEKLRIVAAADACVAPGDIGALLRREGILDIFSRYVVGWMVAEKESAELAEQLIADSAMKEAITPGMLTLHADRGSSMRSKAVATLLADLGIAKSHSRPYISDDNPYSEAQFKTLKYQPGFPERFGSLADARAHCAPFFAWYNQEHRHSGGGMMTPESVHTGRAAEVHRLRQVTLQNAFERTPNRFKNRLPQPHRLPTAAWINPPTIKKKAA